MAFIFGCIFFIPRVSPIHGIFNLNFVVFLHVYVNGLLIGCVRGCFDTSSRPRLYEDIHHYHATPVERENSPPFFFAVSYFFVVLPPVRES